MIQHDAGPTGVVPGPGDPPEPTSPAAASATHCPPERREVSFRTSGLSIQLEISGTAHSRRLAGQLIPRQSAVVDIRHSTGMVTVEADALGRFSAEAIPPGAVSLRCHLGTPISTGWIALLPPPLSLYSALGGLRQDPGHAAEWLAGAPQSGGNGVAKCMCCCRPWRSG